LGPIPNPQSPIPNPQSIKQTKILFLFFNYYEIIYKFNFKKLNVN